MNDDQIREVYRKIANGYGHHGDFLTNFAKAFIRADIDNFEILKGAALVLILKYNLESYKNVRPQDMEFPPSPEP